VLKVLTTFFLIDEHSFLLNYRIFTIKCLHMAIAKKNLFTIEENRIADLAKAIAHPARVSILLYLIKKNNCVCGDIVEELPLSQSTVSQHLKELKRVGILKGDIEVTKTCYCINPKVWKEMEGLFSGLTGKFEGCC
jgi:ArsR family transcriptional regulator